MGRVEQRIATVGRGLVSQAWEVSVIEAVKETIRMPVDDTDAGSTAVDIYMVEGQPIAEELELWIERLAGEYY